MANRGTRWAERANEDQAELTKRGLPSQLFNSMDFDANGMISRKEWVKAFELLLAYNTQVISRKRWAVLGGENHIFDAIVGDSERGATTVISRKDWEKSFDKLDKDSNGNISFEEWCGAAGPDPRDQRELSEESDGRVLFHHTTDYQPGW